MEDYFTKRSLLKRRGVPLSAPLISEINMTPFVDIVLVLLIIFMISAPFLVQGVSILLPKVHAAPIEMRATPLHVSIDAKGTLFIEKKPYPSLKALLEALEKHCAQPEKRQNQQILLAGDRSLSYQKILQLLAALQQAGFSQLSLVSLPKSQTSL